METMAMGKDGFRQLRESLAYKQSGIEGKRRMERLATMGLPVNTDINKIQQVGYDLSRRQPIYQAPRPQSWGTYGNVGVEEDRKGPSPSPSGGPQPQKSTNIPTRSMGTAGSPLAFTRFGGRTGASPMPTSTMNPLLNLSVPRFPFGGY
jgi:hypothetical protein